MVDTAKADKDTIMADSATNASQTLEGVEQKNLEADVKEKIKKEATLLFLQGKRSVYIRDFQAAIATLSESCQLFSQIYSTQDDAMADPYYYYGKALLEVGRSESEVLGDQMQEDEKENDDDDDEDDDEEENENEEGEDDKAGIKSSENGTTSENLQTGETEASSTNNENENDNEAEDVNDLQLSWEYLELAKLIYLRKAETCKETAIKLAETYLCLGENGLESENYSIAINDIKEALSIQQKHLLPIDRRIAETFYQLGIAHSLSQNHDEAIENFKKAIDHLHKKIESLELRKKMGDKKTEEEEKDAFYTMDGEIKEIQEVIKDIEEKIKDMVDSKNQVKAELVKSVISGGNQAGASSSKASTETGNSSSSSIPANDISHLIKKKRKNDEEEPHTDKKTKLES